MKLNRRKCACGCGERCHNRTNGTKVRKKWIEFFTKGGDANGKRIFLSSSCA